ncbi:MAG: cob(I)yrinic acid a,c-diamide adenosyltransferase [Desulfuromonas sp. SDB]|nr:MAG: cob(I)yrinic acid a,c-diamide adenosyltransferase [Desulfuromonas sp. SDB]
MNCSCNQRGYFQVYTGDGKGKTTAALGLAIRAAGAGKQVYVGQFMKGKKYSEHIILDRLNDHITYELYGTAELIHVKHKPDQQNIQCARNGYDQAKQAIQSSNYDVIILDEINITVYFKLLKVEDLIELVKLRSPDQELIFTGRKAPEQIIELADLVTEMKEVKHYYRKGITAREGIEH